MTVEQFTRDYGFSERDSFAAQKMYAEQDKTVQEWHETLKNDFTYVYTESPVEETGTDGNTAESKNKKK